MGKNGLSLSQLCKTLRQYDSRNKKWHGHYATQSNLGLFVNSAPPLILRIISYDRDSMEEKIDALLQSLGIKCLCIKLNDICYNYARETASLDLRQSNLKDTTVSAVYHKRIVGLQFIIFCVLLELNCNDDGGGNNARQLIVLCRQQHSFFWHYTSSVGTVLRTAKNLHFLPL